MSRNNPLFSRSKMFAFEFWLEPVSDMGPANRMLAHIRLNSWDIPVVHSQQNAAMMLEKARRKLDKTVQRGPVPGEKDYESLLSYLSRVRNLLEDVCNAFPA